MISSSPQSVRRETSGQSACTALLVILVILSSFPFVFPNPFISTGIQPYAILLSSAVLLHFFLSGGRVNISTPPFLAIGVATYIALFIALVSLINVSPRLIGRELCAYLNVFVVPAAFYLLRKRTSIDLEPVIKTCIWIWIVVGLLQTFIRRDMFASLLAFHQTSDTRGVFGLATEPSYFGIQLFFFLYCARFFKRNKAAYYLLLAASALLIVKSLTSLIFVAAFFAVELIDYGKLDKLIVIVSVIVILGLLFANTIADLLSGSRLAFLVGQVVNSGVRSLSSDLSTMGRVTRITDSLSQAYEASFIPQGYADKFGSPWGGALNHLGLFGAIYIISIPLLFSNLYSSALGKVAGFIAIFGLFFSTVQMSNPMIGVIIGFSLVLYTNGNHSCSPLCDS